VQQRRRDLYQRPEAKERQRIKNARPESIESRRAYHRTERAREKARVRDNTPHYRAVKRDYQLRKKFGIALAEYDRMLAAQGGHCALCPRTEPRGIGEERASFAVDHDHATGKIRGLLCLQCNIMLGNADDNPELLRSGASYIEMHRN
jgi:hypothetical protein